MLLRALLHLVLLVLLSCGGSSWDAAVDDANEKRKVLIVEFYADWCGPCKYFEANVLTDSEVEVALQRVAFVRYDFDSTAGKHHARRLGIQGVPAVVSVDRKGKAFRVLNGAASKEAFLRFLAFAQERVYGAGDS